MSELDSVIERLRLAYAAADRSAPFKFISSITTVHGEGTCVVVLAADALVARSAAARSLAG